MSSESKHELTIKLAPTSAGFAVTFREARAVSNKDAETKRKVSEENGTECATLPTALDVIQSTAQAWAGRVAEDAEPDLFA